MQQEDDAGFQSGECRGKHGSIDDGGLQLAAAAPRDSHTPMQLTFAPLARQ